jgi:peptide deformylase
VSAFDIRIYGDPVLRQRAADVDDIDGSLKQLVDGMVETMYAVPGLGVAAPQVGVSKRMFVYDVHDEEGAKVLINPTILESSGEWTYDEGCLSVPHLYFRVVRPKDVLLAGWDLDGNEVRIEATDVTARLFQHEADHLDGILVFEHLEPAQRKAGLRILRERQTLDGQMRKGEPVTIDRDGEIVDDD